MLVITCLLLILLANVVYVIQAKHARRIAQARLEIVKTVTAMEKMMLEKHICLGDICHDVFHQRMLHMQYGHAYRVDWLMLWNVRKNPQAKRLQNRIHREISNDTELGKLLGRYLMANYRVFANEKPFSDMTFRLWVLIQAGGLIMIFSCILACFSISIFTKATIQKFRDAHCAYKANIAEWYMIVRSLNKLA